VQAGLAGEQRLAGADMILAVVCAGAWLNGYLDLRVPTRALIDGHDAPFDYLCHAFFDGVRGLGRVHRFSS